MTMHDAPLTDVDLDAVKARTQRVAAFHVHGIEMRDDTGLFAAECAVVCNDVPRLIAEVRKLRKALEVMWLFYHDDHCLNGRHEDGGVCYQPPPQELLDAGYAWKGEWDSED